jgi:hypothetical protein
VMSFSFAASTARPTGIPLVSVSKLLLTPFLPRSVGLGPLFSPAERRFCHRSIHGHPRPVNPLGLVVLKEPLLPKTVKQSLLSPALEPSMRSGTRADSSGVQRIPLTASVQNEKNGIEYDSVVLRLSTAFARMGIFPGRNPWLDFLPKLIRNCIALFGHGVPSHRKVSPFNITTAIG